MHLIRQSFSASKCAQYTVGRQANSDQLNLEAGGLQSDGRGKLIVNEHFQPAVSHLRGRRRGRISRARQYFDGAGEPGKLSHVWYGREDVCQSNSLWHLHHPGDLELLTLYR